MNRHSCLLVVAALALAVANPAKAQSPAATPRFSPQGGTYTSIQYVSLSDSTPGSSIYYTTDGSTPTTNSTHYTSGYITVGVSTTINAIATAPGYATSAVGSASYTINLPPAATPGFSPAGGTYTSTQWVLPHDGTSGATIYYTTDGTTPTANSTQYTSGYITVSSTTTLKAIATAPGYSTSAVGSATYTINLAPAATPSFSPSTGTYTSTQYVLPSDGTSGASIYYTTDGSTPTTSSTHYTSGYITVGATTTIKAIATASGYSTSAVGSATYTINLAPAATPSFSPAAGTYTSIQYVLPSDSTSGATIYYTTDGTTPTTNSTQYTSGFITVGATETLKAIATAPGYSTSAVGSATYTINLAPAATPSFSPAAGTYTSIQYVLPSDGTSGATIYYTTDGTTPTTNSTQYTSGFITVGASETIKAIATAPGYSTSAVGSAPYTINLAPAATPVFNPPAGTYTSIEYVTISDQTSGASIYYTTDGTTPTTNSTQYTSGFITVGATETLRAIATAPGYSTSAVASASYTILLPAATPTFNPGGGSYSTIQSVTINDGTPGASIYYTLDGSTPTTNSTLYAGGKITVASNETIKAIATASGYSTSSVVTAAYTINLPPAPTPSFTPPAGTYTSVQYVTLSDGAAGASIYYTTDGSTPTVGSTLYAGGNIGVGATTTINAIAVAPGYSASGVGTATYTFPPPAATPSLSPLPGAYPGLQNVSLSTTTPGADMYYTTDGSVPDAGSAPYDGPIQVTSAVQVQAVADAAGYTSSPVASGSYSLSSPVVGEIAAEFIVTANGSGTVQSPEFSTASLDGELLIAFVSSNGPSSAPQTATVTGAGLTWTLLERSNSQPGTAEIWMAVAMVPLTSVWVQSQQSVTGYEQMLTIVGLTGAQTATGAGQAASGASGAPSVSLTSSSAGSWLYAVGSDFTSSARRVPGSGQTIVAEVADGVGNSDLWTQVAAAETNSAGVSVALSDSAPGNDAWNLAAIEVLPVAMAAPTFTPAAGTYTGQQMVTLVVPAGEQGRIFYTLDGSTPTTSSSLYSGPIAIGTSTTIKAILAGAGYANSPVASAAYTILALPAAGSPTASPGAGWYASAQYVSLSCSNPNSTIRVTTDGSTATGGSPAYDSPLHLYTNTTVSAICQAPGYADSAPGSFAYTFPGGLCAPGLACDDGDPCTYGDTCNGQGQCVGTPITCISDACTARTCNGTSSCSVVYSSVGTTCDDANPCTYADRCDGMGGCAGTPVICVAAGPCQTLQCNGTSSCSVAPLAAGTPCGAPNTCGQVCDGVSPNCQPAE